MERLKKIGVLKTAPACEIGESRIGLGFEKLDRKAFEPEKAYDLVANTGVHFVRIQSGWQRTEIEKGVYDFAWLDQIVDELIARGMEPWICLCYGNPLYTPLAKEMYGSVGCAPVDTEEERKAWHDYVVETVKRYQGRVTWFEIWNEPDGNSCWKPLSDAEAVAEFNYVTAQAVKEANPEAKVIGGTLRYINLPFFKVLFERGLCDVVDAVSFHRYNANELEALNEIRALRALIDQYNPKVGIIQGESGTQSDSRGAGALRGGAWTPLKQAKYLLRHRLLDLSSEVVFTSHFSAMDMVEALKGRVNDKASYLDYGYFGVIQADFNEDGLATGEYRPKLSYRALQHLTTLFRKDAKPCQVPVRRVVNDSPRFFGKDEGGSRFVSLGFEDEKGRALAYWNAADLMRETYEGTVSFQLAGEDKAPLLVDLLEGSVYELPESMLVREFGRITQLVNLPLTDVPMMLLFNGFGEKVIG